MPTRHTAPLTPGARPGACVRTLQSSTPARAFPHGPGSLLPAAAEPARREPRASDTGDATQSKCEGRTR